MKTPPRCKHDHHPGGLVRERTKRYFIYVDGTTKLMIPICEFCSNARLDAVIKRFKWTNRSLGEYFIQEIMES